MKDIKIKFIILRNYHNTRFQVKFRYSQIPNIIFSCGDQKSDRSRPFGNLIELQINEISEDDLAQKYGPLSSD